MVENIFLFALKCTYIMLPAYFANMAPVIVKKIGFLDYPVDFNKKFIDQPIFGKHKTFRGFFFGILFALLIAFGQYLLSGAEFFMNISILDYSQWALIGLVMGLGALIGDVVKSFFKRRADIEPGHRFIPFDQTDFVIGALAFTMIFFELSWQVFVTALVLSFILHIIVNHIAFWLKIRNEAW
jgi:CDP-2,3-bis-(O-geranylgeranyl)-sn-glycerol synthase